MRITGLRTAAKYNGKVAFVDSYNKELSRWNVKIVEINPETGEEQITAKAFKEKFLQPTAGNIVMKSVVRFENLSDEVMMLLPEKQQGYVVGYDTMKDRWKIRLLPGSSHGFFSEANMIRIDPSELDGANQAALDGLTVLNKDAGPEPER